MVDDIRLAVLARYRLVGRAKVIVEPLYATEIVVDIIERKFLWGIATVERQSQYAEHWSQFGTQNTLASLSVSTRTYPLTEEEVKRHLTPDQIAEAMALCISES